MKKTLAIILAFVCVFNALDEFNIMLAGVWNFHYIKHKNTPVDGVEINLDVLNALKVKIKINNERFQELFKVIEKVYELVENK